MNLSTLRANSAGSVEVDVHANLGPLEAGFKQAEKRAVEFDRRAAGGFNTASSAARRMAGEVTGAAARIAAANDDVRGSAMRLAAANDNVTGSASRMALGYDMARRQVLAFGGALASVFGAREVLRAADDFTKFTNSLRVTGLVGNQMVEVQTRLFAAANQNGVAINALGTLYSRASIAGKELGASQGDLLRFVDGVTAALRVQGGSTEQASGALLQLSQALGSGIVRAEEFNSILEGAFPIAQAAARGIDGMNGSVAKLRTAVVDGKVTSQEFFEGLLKGFTATEAQAANMALTVDGSITVLRNSFLRFVGALDSTVGASGTLGAGIQGVGRTFDALAQNIESAVAVTIAAVTLLAARIAGPLVGAQVAAASAAASHAAALISGNAILISSRKAADLRAASLLQGALAEQVARTAALEAAQVDLVRARNMLALANANQVAGITQAQAQAAVVAASRQVTVAQTALAAASARTTVAIQAQTVAMAANSAAARVMAGAAAVASRALALIGGPAGVAILAVGAALYMASQRALEAQERSARYADAIRKAGEDSSGASGGIREVASALAEVEQSATGAEQALKRVTTQNDISAFAAKMDIEVRKLGATLGWSGVDLQLQLQELRKQFFAGSLSVEDLLKKLDGIAASNPDATAIIVEIQKIAREAAAAMGTLDSLQKKIADVVTTPKTDRLKPPALTDKNFNDRFGTPYADDWKKIFPDLYKAREEQDKLAKSYKDLIDSAERRNRSLEVELEMVGKAGAAAEAYRYSEELILEAMRDGIELTPEKISQIRALAEQYGELTQAIAEAQAMSDLMFEREQIGRSPIEQEVAASLRDLYGDDYKQYTDGAIAETIRFNLKLEEQQEFVEDLAKTFTETLGGALYEVFSGGIRNADDFFEFIAKGFAGLASKNFDKFVESFTGSGGIFANLSGTSGSATSAKQAGAEFGKGFASVAVPAIGKSFSYPDSVGPGRGLSMGGPSLAVARTQGVAIAQGITPVLNKTFSSQMDLWAAAVRKIESGSYGGNYGALGQVITNPKSQYYGDRAYGAYQVMGGNIASWTKEVLGSSMTIKQFLADESAQDKVFYAKFGQSLAKFGSAADAVSVHFTGRPVSTAGNPSDGYNTNSQYISKFDAALKGLGGSVQAGATEGTKVGSQKGIETGVLKLGDMSSDMSGSAQSSGGGMSAGMQGLMGMLGAGLGGFSTGYQSASPGMGALGGALQGWGAGASLMSALPAMGMAIPVIGAFVGAIGGLIGGILGQRKKIKEAQQQLEKQRAQIDALLAVGEGKGVGSGQKMLTDYLNEISKAVEIAWAARDMALVGRLQESYNIMYRRLEKDFRAGYDITISAYANGRGQDDPALKGQQAIAKLREELRNMIADVIWFNDKLVESAKINNVGAELIAFYEAQRDKQIKEATNAAIQMAMSVMVGVPALSSMEQEMAAMHGAAKALQATLEELGLTAGVAAKTINDQLTQAIAKLQQQYKDEQAAKKRDVTGYGYINDIIAAQQEYENALRDAAALGIEATDAQEILAATLKKIASEAELTDESLKMLAKGFPKLAAIFESMMGGNLSATHAAAVSAAQAKVDDAMDKLRAAVEKQTAELENQISTLKNLIDSLTAFRKSLRLDKSVSPLSPYERMIEAQRQFQEVSAAALAGDPEALGRLEAVSRAYLEEARAYYGSTEAYYAIFTEVESILDSALAQAEAQLSEAEMQLEELKKQTDVLLGIDDSVLTVAEAIEQLTAAQAALAEAIKAKDAYEASLIQQYIDSEASKNTVAQGQVTQMYQSVLGRAPDPEGLEWWINYVKLYGAGPGTYQHFATTATNNGETVIPGSAPGFAQGGFTGMGGVNQVAGVVHGQEFVMNAEATRRWRPQFEAMNAGGMPESANDNKDWFYQLVQTIGQNKKTASDPVLAELLKEISKLREEIEDFHEDSNEGMADSREQAKAQVEQLAQMRREQALETVKKRASR